MNNECDVTKSIQILKDSLTYRSCILVTPSDTDLLPYEGRVVVLTTAGTVKVATSAGDVVTLTLAVNEILPLIVKKVFNTGTNAAGIYILR